MGCGHHTVYSRFISLKGTDDFPRKMCATDVVFRMRRQYHMRYSTAPEATISLLDYLTPGWKSSMLY